MLKVNQAIIEELDPLVVYKIKIVPFNDVGDGPASKVLEVETPASQFKQLLQLF